MVSSELNASLVIRASKWLWRLISLVVVLYLAWLAVSTALRVRFPWDLYIWAESPFMTNMLKLEQHQPIFSPPTEVNSFVYSPGLEYLSFALLKPLGLNLDVRACRLLNVLFGISAGILAGLGFRRALMRLAPGFPARGFCRLGAGVAVLVVFRNFTADVTHPDNLVMLHTALLFFLTLRVVETRSLGWALVTMGLAGLGVFTKQILMLAFLGPALIFARNRLWPWRTWWLVAALGALSTLAALAILWRPAFARFYTWEVLSRQGVHFMQFYWLLNESLHGDRAVLWLLGLAALTLLWTASAGGRKFVELWLVLGVFSVWPNAASYLKQMGTWNNLIIFQLWLLFLVWPALGFWQAQALSSSRASAVPDLRFGFLLNGLTLLFVLLLLPTHLPPNQAMYGCCASVQDRVSADLNAGRKVLVAHGTMYQLRAGSREIPRDRANSFLELDRAGLAELTGTAERIHNGYYDRIYLTMPDWYDPKVLAAIEQRYQVQEVIPKPAARDRIEFGYYLPLMGECKVFSRR